MEILADLNPSQRGAAEAVRGPVCILAGAGSGKTTTITRRIAQQVATGTFAPMELLAVTFTDKAAGVMKARLAALGVSGVTVRTFHAEALAQLHRYRPGAVGTILPAKAMLLRQVANGLPPPFRFRPAADLATEIEWAKSQRIAPEDYAASLGNHEPPIPVELMSDVYAAYELRKGQRGEIDFEDILAQTIALIEGDERARTQIHTRYRAFTVDEYQDVNLLQQALLDQWLGSREELCVVGDDYQSIYGFTGASPRWLLGVEQRYPSATVVRLEDNYRSSPQVLELANRLVPRLGGAQKVLRATRPDGVEPRTRGFASPQGEVAWIASEVERLVQEGVILDEIAVLCRTNARLADFEELFHEARVPFQGSSLLAREAARHVLRVLGREQSGGVAARVRTLAAKAGLLETVPDRLGDRELTRQADLARLVRLAAELDDGELTCAGFVAELRRRFDPGGEAARGVHLLTYHRSKGLEFDAVFLPRLEEKELPSRFARTPVDVAEERRLLYVGITRARRWLAITWSRKPSRFLAELGVAAPAAYAPASSGDERRSRVPSAAVEVLRRFRLEWARAEGVPAYVIFPDRTIDDVLEKRPSSLGALAAVHGLGPSRLGRFGPALLAAAQEAFAAASSTASETASEGAPAAPREAAPPAASDGYRALAEWRTSRSRSDAVPPFYVFHDRVLAAIAAGRPRSHEELAEIAGVGPAKIARYGDEVLQVISGR